MSAVVSFVEDTFEAVGDVFEAVGDVVEDVVDVVGDVVDKVGDVVQAVIDDPVPVLLSVAGSFVGIPPMVTMGALTAARGGDLEDIALSMGTAYIGSAAGAGFTNSISSTFSSTFIEAGANETFAQIASDSITKGLVNGTIAEVRGGSFEDGFAGGAIGGLVAGGVGEVGDYVKPDIVELAMESGLDLKEATSLYNAGAKAFTSGITSEITGKGDFATSFANSAVGSGVDAGTRSLNATIDEQFASTAYQWNKEDKGGEVIDTTAVGAGIPNELVGQVTVSGYGVDNNAGDDLDTASVIDDYYTDDASGNTAVSDATVLPTSDVTTLAQAPEAESTYDFADLMDTSTAGTGDTVLASNTDTTKVPDEVSDIAETLTATTNAPTETQGALTTIAETGKPVDVLDVVTPDSTVATDTTVTEAPIAGNLLTTGLPSDQPVGGLNAVSAKTEDKNLVDSLGFKATDITKPIVATVGNLLKSTLRQGTKPQARPQVRPVANKPVGGLQRTAGVPKPRNMPPARVDVAKLMPIKKAAPVTAPKTLASTAKLSPVSNIAGLTSLVKKTG